MIEASLAVTPRAFSSLYELRCLVWFFQFIVAMAGFIIGLSSTQASTISWRQSDRTIVFDVRRACCMTFATEKNVKDIIHLSISYDVV
jgi:hypothetical protein